jgi:hypothetical protein
MKALSGIAKAHGRDRSDYYMNCILSGELEIGIMWNAGTRGPGDPDHRRHHMTINYELLCCNVVPKPDKRCNLGDAVD